ncbi:MAG TPA: HD domain-containing protein [Geobacteraceae bacterium]|nr:HD domain-containing protein [Geobacteraceae bacterium]
MKCLDQQMCPYNRVSISGKGIGNFLPKFEGACRAFVERLCYGAVDGRLALAELKEWFLDYSDYFALENAKHQQSILLKKKHTFDVCKWAVNIARKLGLNDRDTLISEASAILHDTGRFEQCRTYGTFWDKHSFNHAEAGAEIIREHRLLRRFAGNEQNVIMTAVRYHNAFRVPDFIRGRELFFLRLLRDADKIDILNIFSHYYQQPAEERCHIAGLDLVDGSGCSPEILEDLRNRRNANRDLVRTTADHLLLKFSFLFDINFDESLAVLAEEGCMGRLAKALPDEPEIKDIVAGVRKYFHEQRGVDLFRA